VFFAALDMPYVDARYDPSLAPRVRWNIIALVPGQSHFSDSAFA